MPLIAEITRDRTRALRVSTITIDGERRLALQRFEMRSGANGGVWAAMPGGLALRPEDVAPLIEALRSAHHHLQAQPAETRKETRT